MRFYVSFNRISVISGQWKGKHERPCAMKRRLASERISPSAEFEPETPGSDFENAKSSAMRSLLVRSRKQANVTLTTMPIIWIGTKTICPFLICGLAIGWGADITSRLCFASLIILYRIDDINDIKNTKTLSNISSLLRWIMHQSFVSTPPGQWLQMTGALWIKLPTFGEVKKGHLVSMCTWCFHYFRQTRSPSHNFFEVKTFKKCNLQILKFIPCW